MHSANTMTDSRRHTDRLLDTAIDHAVRGMMQAEGRPDTRARVFSRLEERPTPLVTIPRLVAATALAAVLVVAFAVSRGPAPVPTAGDVARTTPLPAGPSEGVRVLPHVSPPPEQMPHTGRTRARPNRRTRAADAGAPDAGFTSTIAIAPLRQIDPIVVSALLPAPVEPDDIVIPPLAPIAELEIAPLFPSDGRN
jgi:hypothetical protein